MSFDYDVIVVGGGSPGEPREASYDAVAPTFSEIYLGALKALHSEIAMARQVAGVAP